MVVRTEPLPLPLPLEQNTNILREKLGYLSLFFIAKRRIP